MAETYGLRLGPLRFVTALSDVAETLGDQLEQVGASAVPGDRRPRPFNLEIPVRAAAGDADPHATGMRLRRQVRQLMENTAWRMQGLPFTWDIDPDLSCWLLVGGGDLTEIEDGLTFGEFKLSLTDCYVAGRPGTHLEGRRLDYGDRRTGLVPRDSWGEVYSTAFDAVFAFDRRLVIPGDVLRPIDPADIQAPTAYGGRMAARWLRIDPGGVQPFVASRAIVTGPDPDLTLSDYGICRVWTTPTGMPGTTTTAGDLDPTIYGWEQVLGPLTSAKWPLAIDNGVCRISYLGNDRDTQGLLLQRWNTDRFQGGLRLDAVPFTGLGIPDPADLQWIPIEVTSERVEISVGLGPALDVARIILQRGWTGPRIEMRAVSYSGAKFRALAGALSVTGAGSPENLYRFDVSGVRQSLVAPGTDAFTHSIVSGASFWETTGGRNSLQFQISLGREEGANWSHMREQALASLAVEDIRSVPVLVER